MKFIRDQHTVQKQMGFSKEVMKQLYPLYFTDRNRKRILLVNPNINRFELFTLIGPAFYLSAQSKKLICMMTGFEPDKREFEDTSANLEILGSSIFYDEYVKMSDVVILPFSYQQWGTPSTPAGPDTKLNVYEKIRLANPFIKIVFTVDCDFYDIHEGHYNSRTIKKNIKVIEDNIRYADAIITGHEDLPGYIQEKSGLKGIRAIIIPSYFDRFHFTDLDFEKPPEHEKGKKIRIGIPSDLFRRPDIEHFKDLYLWLQNTYKNEVDLVFYGYHPNKEIDLRDTRTGIIDNKDIFPKTKGRSKPNYFTNYQREKRNDYVYNFKNIYNLNCDVWLYFYNPDNAFWKYSPFDVDLLYSIFAELPVITNKDLTGFPDLGTKEKLKAHLVEFIQESIKTRRIPTNRFKQFAINFGYEVVPKITWNPENFAAMEEQFVNLITY